MSCFLKSGECSEFCGEFLFCRKSDMMDKVVKTCVRNVQEAVHWDKHLFQWIYFSLELSLIPGYYLP